MTTTAERTAPSRRAQLKFVLVLGGLTAFGPLSIDMYLPALPRMAADLHAADSTVQLTLSAFIAGLALGQLVLGPLSDALGRRRPLLAGLALYVVGSVLCAVSPDAWLLVAARFVQSLGAAAGIVIARATVRDLFSGTAMTKFFSTLMLVSGLAPILAPLIGGQLLNWTSWRGVFVVLTAFGALLLTVVVFFLPEPSSSRSPVRLGQVMRTYGRLVLDRSFAGYALASGLLFASMFAYISGSSFALQGVYGLSPQAYSVVFGVNGVGIVVAGQLNGRLVGRVRERALLLCGLVLGVAGGALVLASVVFRAPLVVLLVSLFLLVSSIGLVMPNASSLALASHARSAGAASALLGVLQFVVGAVATPLVGLGGPGTALPMAATMAGFAVLALVAYLTLARPSEGPEMVPYAGAHADEPSPRRP